MMVTTRQLPAQQIVVYDQKPGGGTPITGQDGEKKKRNRKKVENRCVEKIQNVYLQK
nr:hypothetical protein [uncultured Gemmiger sp.]